MLDVEDFRNTCIGRLRRRRPGFQRGARPARLAFSACPVPPRTQSLWLPVCMSTVCSDPTTGKLPASFSLVIAQTGPGLRREVRAVQRVHGTRFSGGAVLRLGGCWRATTSRGPCLQGVAHTGTSFRELVWYPARQDGPSLGPRRDAHLAPLFPFRLLRGPAKDRVSTHRPAAP